MNLNFCRAEFDHVVVHARLREESSSDQPNSANVELFDAMDSLPEDQLRELVALYLYGCNHLFSDIESARNEAEKIGWEGIDLLHRGHELHVVLLNAVNRIEKIEPVIWQEGAG